MWSPRQVLWRHYVALRPCKCGGSRALLRDALDVVAQLGNSPGEEEQLLRLWAAGVGHVGRGRSSRPRLWRCALARVVW